MKLHLVSVNARCENLRDPQTASTRTRKTKPRSPHRSSIELLVALVVIAITLVGCTKSVPAPWKGMGVPTEHLIEVFGGTNSQQFSGAYNQDPRGVAEAFAAGLKQSGVNTCGRWIQKQNGEVIAFFSRDANLWKLTCIKASADRTPTRLVVVDDGMILKEDLDKTGCMLK